MEIAIQTALKFEIEDCITCGIKFAMPKEFVASIRNKHSTFYCPNGHSMFYNGENEAEKVRRELKLKEQELAEQVQQRILAEQEQTRLKKQLKRVHKGTCPCCKRSFQDLKRHMETKHPELANAQ